MDELAQRMRPRLVRALRRRLGNAEDAEDVAQATLMRLYEQRHRYDPRRPFGPWLFTIAYRLATDHRRRRREPTGGIAAGDDQADAGPGPSDVADERETRGRVWGIADRVLNEQQWTAIWLAYGEGMTPTEVAGVMGIQAGNARVLLHRARAALAPHLAEEMEPEPGKVGSRSSSLKTRGGDEAGTHRPMKLRMQT